MSPKRKTRYTNRMFGLTTKALHLREEIERLSEELQSPEGNWVPDVEEQVERLALAAEAAQITHDTLHTVYVEHNAGHPKE